MKYAFVVVGTLLALGAGCTSTPHESAQTPQDAIDAMNRRIDQLEIVAEGGATTTTRTPSAVIESRFRLATNQFPLGPQTLAFQLTGANRKPLEPEQLKLVHEKLVHLLLVRKDMTEFQHLHPTFADGRWSTDVTFTEPGDYFVYLDVSPIGEAPLVLHETIQVAGRVAYQEPNPNPFQDIRVDGYYAKLVAKDGFKTGHTSLQYTITMESKPAPYEPYLGAFGHVVVLKHFDPLVFVHTHPIDTRAPKNGVITFDADFPSPGRYTIYAQFNLEGAIRLFPITVDVVQATSTSPINTEPMRH